MALSVVNAMKKSSLNIISLLIAGTLRSRQINPHSDQAQMTGINGYYLTCPNQWQRIYL
jgi:hypothetical protein